MKIKRQIKRDEIEVFDLESITEMDLDKKYKFVQIETDEQKTILFSLSRNFHAEIVETYLLEKNIPYNKTILADGHEGPAKQGTRYKIIGAGYVTKNQNTLNFQDKSIGYNIFPNSEHLNKLKDETILEIILKDDALKKIQEKELLENKLRFLHPCLSGAFDEADTYFKEIQRLYQNEDINKALSKKYDSLKEIFKEKGDDALFTPEYTKKLTELRTFLFLLD